MTVQSDFVRSLEASMSAHNALHIAVLAGDGIGPEVMAPALEILRALFGIEEAYAETQWSVDNCGGTEKFPCRG